MDLIIIPDGHTKLELSDYALDNGMSVGSVAIVVIVIRWQVAASAYVV